MEMTKGRRRAVVVVVALCGVAALAYFVWRVVFPVYHPLKDLRVDEVVSIHLTENHGLTDVTLDDEDREYVAALLGDLEGSRVDGQLPDMSGTEPIFTVETTTKGTIEARIVGGTSYFKVGEVLYQENFGASVVQKLEEVYQRHCDW